MTFIPSNEETIVGYWLEDLVIVASQNHIGSVDVW